MPLVNPEKDLSLEKINLLHQVQMPCYDDGKRFTETAKLDRIRHLLKDSTYTETKGNLFRLYTKCSPDSQAFENVVVISSHADFVSAIRHPFLNVQSGGMLKGTFDNAATNAAALFLMLYGDLPDNVFVAFTGNEESGMRGAVELDRFLCSRIGGHPCYLTLDVTDIGFKEKSFSIENTFSLPRPLFQEIIGFAKETGLNGYCYPRALPDEAYAYARQGAHGCSICVPTKGPMHSDAGCKMELRAYLGYIDVVGHIAKSLAARLSRDLENIPNISL